MKQPWMKFYPTDWMGDKALRLCSLEARGLWMDMICIMHEADPYGTLVVNGAKIDERSLGLLVGIDVRSVSKLLGILEKFGVFSKTEDGTIYSKRMRRDYERSQIYRANGKRGGSPVLLKQKEVICLTPSPSKLDNTQNLEARSQKVETTSLPSARVKAADRKERAKNLPEGFSLTEGRLLAARSRGWPDHRTELEFTRFCDHARANGRQQVDWDASWRNWITSSYQEKGNGNGRIHGSEKGNSVVEAGRRLLASIGERQSSFEGIEPSGNEIILTIPEDGCL